MADLKITVSNKELAEILPVNTWIAKADFGKIVNVKGVNLNNRLASLLNTGRLERDGFFGIDTKYRMTEEMRVKLWNTNKKPRKTKDDPTRFFVKKKAQAEKEAYKQDAEMILKKLKWF